MPKNVYDRALQAVPDLQAQAHLTICHGEVPATLLTRAYILRYKVMLAEETTSIRRSELAHIDFDCGSPSRAAGIFARVFGLPVGSRKCTKRSSVELV